MLLCVVVLSAPNLVIMILFVWLIPESPRWLITKNKTEKLVEVLDKAASTNKKTLPLDKLVTSEVEERLDASDKALKSATVMDLFWPPTILVRSSTMFFNWMVTTMCYYGLTSASATLTPDRYLNYSLAILVEVRWAFTGVTNHHSSL